MINEHTDFDVNEEDVGKVLADLLVGNVDRNMLDSSIMFGRRAENNAKAVAAMGLSAYEYYQATERTIFKLRAWGDGDIELTWVHNIYWWLGDHPNFTYDQKLTKRFYDFVDFLWAHGNKGYLPNGKVVNTNFGHGAAKFFKYAHAFWSDDVQDWGGMPHEEWARKHEAFVGWFNLKGEDELLEDCCVGNTANGEDMLSQIFQYVSIEYDGDFYLAVSIHGGADVRSGYGDTIIFSCDDLPYPDTSSGYLSCDTCDANWDTCNAGYTIEHNAYEEESHDFTSDVVKEYAERNEAGEVTGRLLCPVCKKGVVF